MSKTIVKEEQTQKPKYSKGEEIFNMSTHCVGVALGIVATVLCVIFAAIHKNVYGVVSSSIYGASMIILYTMSSLYHGLSPKLKAKKIFQILDHCSIFLLISGTYTPFALCTLREYNTALGWVIFGVVQGMAVLGIVLNAIDLKKYKTFSMICYLVMGWCVIVKIGLLLEALGTVGFSLLLGGGIIYTIGAICYGIGKKHRYMHTLFHFCVLIASILQFLCIILYVV